MAAAFLYGDGYAKWHRLSGWCGSWRTKIELSKSGANRRTEPSEGFPNPPVALGLPEVAPTTLKSPAALPPQT